MSGLDRMWIAANKRLFGLCRIRQARKDCIAQSGYAIVQQLALDGYFCRTRLGKWRLFTFVPSKAPRPIRRSLDDAPNVTRRRLSHPKKHQSHSSTTLSGIATDSRLVPENASVPIRSSLDDEPNVTHRRLWHREKQPSHSSTTLSGIATDSRLVLENA